MGWKPDPDCPHGSLRMTGPLFDVYQLRGPVFGPTYYRQLRANQLKCVAYAEFHLDASLNLDANHAHAIVPTGAGDNAYSIGRSYLSRLCVKTDISVRDIRTGGKGSGNIARVRAPALLLESGFASNPHWAAFCRTGEGADAIGGCFAEAVRDALPNGGVVCLSVGHAYRGNRDPGAGVADPDGWEEDPEFDSEAELAELQLTAAAEFLVSYPK